MHITQILKRRVSLFSRVFCLCLSVLLGKPAVPQPKTPENVELSAEATQWLQKIKTNIQTYNATLKSGVIDFTLTLSGPTRIPPPDTRKNRYEPKGRWDITYQFDDEHHFYDVKARYKMELNGHPLPNWKETHHQYLRTGKTVHVWEKFGTEWNEQQTMPSHRLEEKINPMRWTQLYTNFRVFTPIDIRKVNEQDATVYALTLKRTDSDATRTVEIYRDPRKSFLPTRIYVYRSAMRRYLITTPFSQRKTTGEEKRLTRYTYKLAQFAPDIWFPQTMTMETLPGYENENQLPKWVLRKFTLQVHRAVFNGPIAEEYPHIPRE